MPGTWPDVPMSGTYEGFIVKGANANGGLGTAVSNAGDIDKDSYDDVMIGAPKALGAGSTVADQTGAVYVIYGMNLFTSPIDLSAMPSNCIKINGENAGDKFGAAIGFAGNVNGDYYDDIIIGAPGISSDAGAAYIVFGANRIGTLDLSLSSSFTAGIKLTGSSSGDLFGTAVSRVGNLNSDQYDDVVIGAPGEGVVYAIYGRATTYSGSVLGYAQKNKLTGGAVGFGGSLGGIDNFNGNDKPDVVIGGDIGEGYVVFDQRCPKVCTGCIDIYSCTGCWSGYELSSSLECEVEESDNFLLDPDTPNIALQISLFIASGLCIGKSAPITIGFLLRIIRNIRFFSIYYPVNLLEVLQEWTSTILTIQPPDTLTSEISSSKYIYAIFTYYGLEARFFLNFWGSLLIIAGSLVMLLLLNGLCFLMKSNNRPGLIHKIISFLATASINFFIVQFYGVFDVIVFYCVLEFRSIYFNSALEDLSFSFAVIFLAFGTALFGLHVFLLARFKNIRSQKSPDLVTTMSAEMNRKYGFLRILYEDFKASGIMQQGFLVIFILRSVLLSVVITTLFEHPLAQTIIYVCFTLFILVILIWKRPFKDLQDAIFHYYCELIIFVVSVGTLVMSILDQRLEENYTTRSRFGKGIEILDIMFNLGGLLYMIILIIQALLKLYLPTYVEKNKAEIFAAMYSRVGDKNTTLDHSMGNMSAMHLENRDEPSLYMETSNMRGDTSKKFKDYSRQHLLVPPGQKVDPKNKGLEIQNVVLNLDNKNGTSVDKRVSKDRRRDKRSIYPSPDLALLKSSLQELKKDLDDEIEWKVLDFPTMKASLMQPRITGESSVMVPIKPVEVENFEGYGEDPAGRGSKVVVIKNSKKRMIGQLGNK